MSVDTYTPYQCWCCDRSETEIVAALAVASRRGEGWANASRVNDIGMTIVAQQGLDLNDYSGVYQKIQVYVAYRVFSAADSDQHGIFRVLLETSHIGNPVVNSANEIQKVESTDSGDPPSPPLYADFNSIDYDSSEVIVQGEVTPEAVGNYAISVAVSSGWRPSEEVVKAEIGNYQSGFFLSDDGQFAAAIMSRYVPGYLFTPAPGSPLVVERMSDVDLEIPLVVKRYQFNVAEQQASESGEDNFNLTWSPEVYFGFYPKDVDLDSPDSAGWRDVGFDGSGETYYSVDVPPVFADVWPLFVVT